MPKYVLKRVYHLGIFRYTAYEDKSYPYAIGLGMTKWGAKRNLRNELRKWNKKDREYVVETGEL